MTTNPVQNAIDQYPATFGLRGFPGHTFQISTFSSYLSQDLGIQLVVQIKRDCWMDFSRCSPAELDTQIVRTR